MALARRLLRPFLPSVYCDAFLKLRLVASLYTFAQRISSPQRTRYTVASLPLINWLSTSSIMPSSTRGNSRFGIFIALLYLRWGKEDSKT